MPLVRFQVRNEYGLGQPDLYTEANREDPKAVLDGVAVAGLVGILRQLGDLAEFAAEVFHGLQEQVTTTASRSHNLMVRVQNIEAVLPPLEKAVLAQTSHIHFAYTSGCEWHPHIRNEENHFIYNDLPRFIMDSYEECRDPPRLHMLDKFDTGGPGSCLKRYSDPTFFRRVSGNFKKEPDVQKVQKDKKTRKSKKKRPSQKTRDLLGSMSNHSSRRHFTPPIVHGRTSPSHTGSTFDMTVKSDMGDNSNSFDSRPGSGHVECVFHQDSLATPEEQEYKGFSSQFLQHNDIPDSVFSDEQSGVADDSFVQSSSPEQIALNSSCVTWDEKAEIVEPKVQHHDEDEAPMDMMTTDPDLVTEGMRMTTIENPDQREAVSDENNTLKLSATRSQLEEIESEPDNYMDALNTIESESENDLDCETKFELGHVSSSLISEGIEDETLEVTEQNLDQRADSGTSSYKESPDISNSLLSRSIDDEQRANSDDESPKYESHTASGTSSYKASPDISNSVLSRSIDDEQRTNSDHESPKYESHTASGTSSYKASPDISNSVLSRSIDDEQRTNSDHEPPKYESHIASDTSSYKESHDISNPVLSRSIDDEQRANTFGKSSNLEHSLQHEGSATAGPFDGSKVESVISAPSSSDPVSSNLPESVKDNTASGSVEPQEPQVQSSGAQSVTIWTNGGLLGLQPSKPPIFAGSNTSSQDSVTRCKGVAVDPQNSTSMPSIDGERGKHGKLDSGSVEGISNSKCSTLSHEDQDARVENSGHSDNSIQLSHVHEGGLNHSSTVTGEELQLNEDVKGKQDNSNNSSQLFGLGHRLLANGFHRKMSSVPDSKPELASSLVQCVSEQRAEHKCSTNQARTRKESNGLFGNRSIVDSLTSSPPLEHMKISFHPTDGLEVSKLKLKFPDGSHCNGSVRDMFPSFQLVPEPAVSLQDVGSDSDDDTFCRSSPCISDDCPSHCSESGSEQWESIGSPESKDHELYDALCRISSVESVQCSLQSGEAGSKGVLINAGIESIRAENVPDSSLSGSLDFPSFDAMSPVLQRQAKDNCDSPDRRELNYAMESSPLLPPLPPVQWRVLKPDSEVTEDQQHISEAHEHAFDLKFIRATLSQQPKPAPAKEQQYNEDPIVVKPKSKQQDQQNLSWEKEANQPSNGKGGMDEQEDFLQQIRTRSFTLRRTVTAKPTFGSGHTANDRVTAILEKANAIRQAVGSDDGEDDDNWSDP